jgi:hypothetical protein
VYRLLIENPKGKRPLGRSRCRWVYNIKIVLVVWTGFVWFRIGAGEEYLECSIELLGSIKCWETIEWLYRWWALK